MHILAAPDNERFPLSAADRDLAAANDVQLREFAGHSPSDFAREAAEASAVIVWDGTYDAAVFEALPNLRVLARCGAGYDNIDAAEARRRGIVVTYCPGVLDASVAEHTIALALAVMHRLGHADREVRSGRWPSSVALGPVLGVGTATLGLVGFGHIARRVAELALGLGFRVTAYDPYASEFPSTVQRAEALDDLLRESDVVSLHVPLTAQTRGLIGARELGRMRSGAMLVNTGRGELVDSEALAAALTAGDIAGAGLDVFDPEPVPIGHPILTAPNVVITPHSAAFDAASLAGLRQAAISDAIAVLEGRRPKNPIPGGHA